MASIVQICHTIAYTIFPNRVYTDLEGVKKLWAEEGLSGPFLYSAACRILKSPANATDATSFRTLTGKLDDGQEYYLLQFPPPPPIDLAQIRPESLPNVSIVLAPFLSVALGSDTLPITYYVLGQGTFGGTTLRYLSSESININLGPGCPPEIERFLELVKTRPTSHQIKRQSTFFPASTQRFRFP
jgi:hypothetical protein